jgi:hypothetical protein
MKSHFTGNYGEEVTPKKPLTGQKIDKRLIKSMLQSTTRATWEVMKPVIAISVIKLIV